LGGHVLFETGIRRLGSKENGFYDRYPGTNETVREERVLARIENLKVPPAWQNARIARNPSAKVQAVGYDSAGRLQYVYNARYREQKEREKFRADSALCGRAANDVQDDERPPRRSLDFRGAIAVEANQIPQPHTKEARRPGWQ